LWHVACIDNMFLITLAVVGALIFFFDTVGALILNYDYRSARLLSVLMDVSVSCVTLYFF
jgi:hypothetical protein